MLAENLRVLKHAVRAREFAPGAARRNAAVVVDVVVHDVRQIIIDIRLADVMFVAFLRVEGRQRGGVP